MAKNLTKKCDKIWKDIILKQAGYRSEVSGLLGRQKGGDQILQAHHIVKKPNYCLRYMIENGICLTMGEHKFGIHGNDEEEWRKKIKRVKGDTIYEDLWKYRYDHEHHTITYYHEFLSAYWEMIND